jgi:hypothetical protein
MTSNHPQRRRQSGPRVLQRAAPAVGAQRRALTDDGAEGIRPPMPMACIFNKFTRSNRHVYATEPRTRRFASNCLIPFMFTHGNL